MLPSVDTHQGNQVAGDGVLIGAGDQSQSAAFLVLGQPSPSAALNTGEGGVGLLLESGKGAKVTINGFLYMEFSLAQVSARV